MKIHIVGGGTVAHIRPHMALCAPAYGGTAWQLDELATKEWYASEVITTVTRMAGGKTLNQNNAILETNEDVERFVMGEVVADPEARVLFMPVALCDYYASAVITADNHLEIGKQLPRLKTGEMPDALIQVHAESKLISKIRQKRKDIFLVGFKVTTGASVQEQFEAGLTLLKKSSCNLVLANDEVTRMNMVITPEQAKYYVTTDRKEALAGLVNIACARAGDDFTHSTVVPGELVEWASEEVPATLRTVVDHLISRGAYRPFLGATVGHFATKLADDMFLTSVRKTDFNNLPSAGLVRVAHSADDSVIAYGAKPSVGGVSQRIIFKEHPEADCIAHAHIQLKPGSKVPVRSQWQNECGSHSCGKNASQGLKDFGVCKAVMLDKHGPNIVFSKNANPAEIIKFIEDNFDIDHQTSELD